MTRHFAAALLALLLIAGCEKTGDAGWAMDRDAPAPAVNVAVPGEAPFSFDATHGQWTLATFGYASCPDVCPATLADWRGLRRALGPDTARVRFAFVSVDWRRDTPETAQAFARYFDPSFIGIAPDSATLERLTPYFKVEARYHPSESGVGFDVAHTDYMYVVDDRGRAVWSYRFGTPARRIAADLKRMLKR